ncbi:Spy/CpxP family protein refolding chaperone [Shewanella youngdeokensis]|uniref:Spy/CpxP family protein refolding chaperone n=1 Tax=Shewanella youngdeokensis TaxID=2999068 RepID=A0ABZ0JXE0_9GAMM|nr:Spy/CpxP family protein refolding chaperone [Shewanella sp. DAU334]
MKKNTLKAGLIALVASTTMLSATLYAADDQTETAQQERHQMKGERGGHHKDMRKMFRGLDLTDEQKTEIKALFTAHRDEMKQDRPSKEDKAAERAQMLTFITAETFNEAEVKEALEAKQLERQQKSVDMLKLQNQVYLLLTPEQQETFKERFAKGKKHHRR